MEEIKNLVDTSDWGGPDLVSGSLIDADALKGKVNELLREAFSAGVNVAFSSLAIEVVGADIRIYDNNSFEDYAVIPVSVVTKGPDNDFETHCVSKFWCLASRSD